jgi:hypothetical protein
MSSSIYFPRFTTPPTPCLTFTRTVIVHTQHGLVKHEVTYPLTPDYYSAIRWQENAAPTKMVSE